MKLEQIYTGCIAHAAYYLESNGEAAIFDPLREVEPYIERAAKDGAVIKYVFETHFHADFVSGHLDLAARTGAQIVYGPTAKPGFEAIVAKDGEEFRVGGQIVRLIHTPGHTMESSCYLITGLFGKDEALITGDTLFIGDVGRPDLAQHVVADLTQEKLASLLYDSLRNKIMPLPDHLIIYPNHGAGSACGKNMSRETTDTLGHQKEVNYALRPDMSREEFISEVLHGLTTPPGYFPKNVLMNIGGYESIDAVMERGMKPLSAETFRSLAADDQVLVLDVRQASAYAGGHIPGSLHIGLEGQFAPWVGALISDIRQTILLVCEPGREQEAITRLARVGYDQCIGYLNGGFPAWQQSGGPVETIERVRPAAVADRMANGAVLLDIRKQSEYETGHAAEAIHIPLEYLQQHLAEIPQHKPLLVHCAGGYRSMIAASLLRRLGFRQVADVEGGFQAMLAEGLPVVSKAEKV
jgi:hydroxyacylglutathione hydrolase